MEIKWNETKNNELKKARGVSFEEVECEILNQRIIDIIEHPNKTMYPNQKMIIIKLKGYIHICPVVISDNEIFLKTIYPDRKYNKKYTK